MINAELVILLPLISLLEIILMLKGNDDANNDGDAGKGGEDGVDDDD